MLQIENLSFGYHSNGYSFSDTIAEGSVVFLAGSNGSGKTSLLKTLAGLLPPLSGNIIYSPSTPTSARPIYLQAHPEVSDWLTAQDVFDIFSNGNSEWRSPEDLADLGIPEVQDRPIHLLSLGEQKRIFLAAALKTSANLLLLDEPLNSLDWNMELVLSRIIKRHVSKGRSFVIAAHQLQWITRFPESCVWFLNEFARLKAGKVEEVLMSTEVQRVFNFQVAFTDNPLDGSRLIATSEMKRTT